MSRSYTSISKSLMAALVVVLAAAGLMLHASVPLQSNNWAATADMANIRAGASATLLPNGLLLIAGGVDAEGASSSAERFSDAGGEFLAAPSMQSARANHTATLMTDGRVLVIGGSGGAGIAQATSEIYDAAANVWLPAGSMNVARRGHTATLLADGRVLVAGGDDGGVAIDSLEIFDPATSTFSAIEGVLSAARTLHAAAALLDGRVLIAGGFDGHNPLASTDIFDSNTGIVSAGANLSVPRSGLSATTLLDGHVLIAGGASPSGELGSAEVFDPESNTFAPTANGLTAARQNHLALLLPHNNQVLIVGGSAERTAVAAAEYYTPWQGVNGSFCAQAICDSGFEGPMAPGTARMWPAGSALSIPADKITRSGPADGRLVLAGGSGQQSAEMFGFATITTDQEDYAPGTTVTIKGSGWQPHEWVAILLKEVPTLDEHQLVDVEADDNGNIESKEFVPDDHDIGIRFYATAFGEKSQAQTTFRDNRAITNATVNGGASVTIAAGQPITAAVFVTTDTGGGGPVASRDDWLSTGWAIDTSVPSSFTCVDTTDHTSAGNYSESFSINAPTTTGTYNAYFVAYQNAACGGGQPSAVYTMTNAVTVTAGSVGSFTVTNIGGGPIATQTAGTAFAIKITALDTYGNVATGFDGGPNKVTIAPSSGSLSVGAGPTASFVNGVLASHSVTFSAVGTYPGTFSLTATRNSGGSQNGISNTFTVNAPACVAASVATNPSNQTVTYGAASASFSVTGNGTPAPTVQWQISSGGPFTNLSNVAPYSGVTTTTLSVANPTVSLSGNQYRAVFTNSCGGTQTATSNAATLTVNKASVTITPNSGQSKVYGASDPTFSYTHTALAGGDTDSVFTGALARVAGENVGPYNITLGTLSAGGNYNTVLAATPVTFAITAKPVTVTPSSGQSKVYGDSNPAYAYTHTALGGTDTDTVFTGALDRASGENVGPYLIDLGTLSAGSNYTLSLSATPVTFAITTKSVTVTPNSGQSKLYGASDPTLTYSHTALGNGDTDSVFSGALSRTTGESVGPYLIGLGSLSASSNYNLALSATPVSFAIAARDLAVTPDSGQNKPYGDSDPTLTYTRGTLYNGDTDIIFSGVLVRASGANVGTYAITQGSLTAGSNYNIQFTAGVTFEITPRDVTVIPDSGQNKSYGSSDPTLTYTHGTLYNGDTDGVFSGSIERATGESAGTYAITQGSLTAGSNYSIQFTASVTFEIKARNLMITPDSGQSKTYGDSDPTLSYTHGTLYNGDTDSVFSGGLSHLTGENVGAYAITLGSLSAGDNYTLVLSAPSVNFEITPKTLTAAIVGDPTKPYDGNANATLSAANFALSVLVGSDSFTVTKTTGTYNSATVAGANTVSTTLTAGDFSPVGGTLAINYTLPTSASGSGHISKADPTIVVTPYSVTYNGSSHTATGTAKGVLDEDLAGLVLTGTTHTNADDYTVDPWTFTDATGNYNDQTGTTHDVIAKATASITVTSYSVTYDGDAHTATGVASGVEATPADLSGLLDLSGTTHTNAGPYNGDSWTFAGNINYKPANGTVDDAIAMANANISVTAYSVTYNGNPHTATGTATGVESIPADLSGLLTLSGTTHTNAGTYNGDAWTFAGNINYKPANGTVDDAIAKANANITVTPYNVAYNGNPHTATGVASGVESTPVDLNGLLNLSGTTHTNAGTYNSDGWSFAGNSNYNPASGAVNDAIAKANAIINVTAYSVPYNGDPHTATGSATGVESTPVNLSALLDLSGTTHTNAATYNGDVWSFAGNTNYNSTSGTVNDAISKVNATITVTPYTVLYDGNPHTATGTAKGVKNESLTALMNVSGTTHTNPGTYNGDPWSFAGDTNYNTANGTVNDSISYGICSGSVGAGGVILPPINSDGSSVYNRKGGSTIPVKFRVCDASGNSISNAAAVFAGTGGALTMLSAVRGTVTTVNEDSATDIPDAAFRWDASGRQWIFNMATSNLTSGSTYAFRVNLATGNIQFVVGVK